MKYLGPKQIASRAAQLERNKSKKRRQRRALIYLLIIAALCVAGWRVYPRLKNKSKPLNQKSAVATVTPLPSPTPVPQLRDFTAEEFRNLYNSLAYPNTEQTDTPPSITGDPDTDNHIRELAEARGYRLRNIARGDLATIDDVQLQPLAIQPWAELKSQAQAAGLSLSLTAGFRSYDDQDQLFLDEMDDQGIDRSAIIDGSQDEALQTAMNRVAPPGYSRHHTGFTVDMQCGSLGLYAFADSDCYSWMSADNFKVIKELGWVPSYPKGADLQGPEPEPWEFIWVGRPALTKH